MDISREAFQTVVQNISSRSDLCSLARVSRPFQRAAERALYNTLYMRDPAKTASLCKLIAAQHRLAILVDAAIISVTGSDGDDNDGDSSEKGSAMPNDYWETLAAALRSTTRLRFLDLHIDGETNYAWILRSCTFVLRAFHCDLSWDADLVGFLDSQNKLLDLYLADYITDLDSPAHHLKEPSDSPAALQSPDPPTVQPESLHALDIIECSFAEAMSALVPGRPVTRIKTCFSREGTAEKAAELSQLITDLLRSKKRLRSLDLADASYTEEFSLTVLGEVARRLPELRYVGTLVLPVGLERLQFFGLLMRLRKLHTIELEVSEWEPPPTPQALRALASELRLYCPSIKRVVFVQDFERTVIRVINGFCTVDSETNADNLWRDV